MPDREKVIKGLDVCVDRVPGKYSCYECPYEIDGNSCEINLTKDALALLKEQEAVEPKKVKGYNPPMYTIYEYECEKCKSPILNKQPYCMGCGRSVKWDG